MLIYSNDRAEVGKDRRSGPIAWRHAGTTAEVGSGRRDATESQDTRGTRYYAIADLLGRAEAAAQEPLTVCYARVSSHDQKDDLERQHTALEAYCATKGWRTQVIRDLGSGMNYRKKGLQSLLELILHRRTERLVITHKDRLLRFGAELVFTLCEMQGIEIVIIHQGEQPSFEEELAQDVLEIITVFSARLYGSRSRKHKDLLESLTMGGEEAVAETARQMAMI